MGVTMGPLHGSVADMVRVKDGAAAPDTTAEEALDKGVAWISLFISE